MVLKHQVKFRFDFQKLLKLLSGCEKSVSDIAVFFRNSQNANLMLVSSKSATQHLINTTFQVRSVKRIGLRVRSSKIITILLGVLRGSA